jgi:hypothetical protein
LIVEELRGGESYAVLSQVPVPAASELAQASVESGPDGTLELPDPVAQKVREISLGVTEGTSNAYEAAVALQNHLRGFRYTLSVPGRHDGDFLLRFLTETKAGYCEQFAAAMAVMLRSIGIPSRVAVGFLPGTPEQGGFTVTNREAHAWTEAYFSGIGWVAFEPTPRAEATPPPYTRPEGEPEVVQEQPSSEGGEPAEPPVIPEVEDGSTVAAPPESSPLAIATKASKRLGILAVVLLVLAASSRQLALMALGRHRRKTLGADAAAFEEMMLLAEDAYRVRLVAETEYEFTRSLMKELELSPDDLGLALVDHWRICYGNGQASDGSQERIKRIRSAIRSNCSWRGKIRMALSPRPVVVLAQILAARFAATRSSSAARSV